ncbi:MAG TPA: alpha-glucan family phosphorylase [Fimbriimonas sp.]
MLFNKVSTLAQAIPRVPSSLEGLVRLSRNAAWAWVPGVGEVFHRLEYPLKHGPSEVLWTATNVDALADDEGFLAEIRRAEAALAEYLRTKGSQSGFKGTVAYFCAEYGLHESIPLYSGGLGILAGDHCKEASDLSLPFVAVGLFYRRGFFHQTIDPEGRQEHVYPRFVPEAAPVDRVLDPRSELPLTVSIEFPGRIVHAAVWRMAVGKVPLLLLDTDVPENAPSDRPITSQLYTSGRDMRLHQEIVLGVGGVRALEALGIEPTVWHLNEGHSALLLLERLRRGETEAEVRDSSVLTIHTPVPAGNERFGASHLAQTVSGLLEGSGIRIGDVLKLGRDSTNDPEIFDMTAFALRLSRMANGVSLLHGKTADRTWRKVAKHPVIGVTNGVHMPTWLGPEMRKVLEQAGARFDPETTLDQTALRKGRARVENLAGVAGEDLWRAHSAQKARMIRFVRGRLVEQAARHGAGPNELDEVGGSLDPNALIVGFARRFATYKRAMLLFSDERRLARLLGDRKRPVQIVIAGKAHPADCEGQKLIAKVYAKTQSPRWRGKVFLVEDYDMEAGRMLVQGADLWLNNPRRPLEASGTSGMKAAANGVPNVSVLDGWWDEAYVVKPPNGFAVGGRKSEANERQQDRSDAEALYRAFEEQVVPTYFDSGPSGVPDRWVAVMRESIATSLWAFSTKRMVEDYAKAMYGGGNG